MPTVTLICEHDGHEWERESQRGRRPRFCPEHVPDPDDTAPSPLSTERWAALADQYESDLLPRTGGEDASILRYVIRQLRRPRSDDDLRFLIDTCRLRGIIPRQKD